ncbi:MAG: adenosylcobinamide-GDP ribazoletransferase [Nitrospinae bacterium]|nr:adenosylcobinamide-GDP ribazoletransferase [Nitrospinota bacterium]
MQLRDNFILSLQFLTIINIRNDTKVASGQIDKERLGKSAIFFPLVGVFIGFILVITSQVASLWLPVSVTDAMVMIVLIIVTGGLHIDGFADTIDGFAGGRDKDSVLRIMKDSRIGTFGVAGLVMLLLTKYLSIQNTQIDVKSWVLASMPVFGRWSVLPLGFFYRYARMEEGTGKVFAESIEWREFIIGTILSLAIILLLLGSSGFIILSVIFFITLLIGRYSEKRIGGITGDVFGATIEINELITIILSLSLF